MGENRDNIAADERLIEAAIDIFGRHGYEAATTRRIGSQAQVNISAIPYYFRGKEGLYRAVILRIVSVMQEKTGDLARNMNGQSLGGETGPALAMDILEDFLQKMISFLVGSSQGQRFSKIILREQMYPSSAYDLVYNGFMEPAILALSKLISIITGETSEEHTKLKAMAVIGQVLAFRVARETVVRTLDYEGYNESEALKISEIILCHTRAALSMAKE